jgi:hypothetical protein
MILGVVRHSRVKYSMASIMTCVVNAPPSSGKFTGHQKIEQSNQKVMYSKNIKLFLYRISSGRK